MKIQPTLDSVIERVNRTGGVFLWSTPRSASTAFERCFKSMPGYEIVHEPFTECYYFGPEKKTLQYGELADAEKYTSAEAYRRLVGSGQDILFVKEMVYQAVDYVDGNVFAALKNVLLLRHPFSVVRSIAELKTDFTAEDIGFSRIPELAASVGGFELIMDGDEFCADPETTLQKFCSILSIPYETGHTSWEDGSIRPWRADEFVSQERWHRSLASSKGIKPSRPRPSLAEIRDLGLSNAQHSILDEAMEVYSTFALPEANVA